MKDQLHLGILQYDIVWEDPTKNKDKIDSTIEAIQDQLDLLVLPEMFSSGFTMNPKAVAETMQGATINWMKLKAAKHQFAITGSLVIEEDGNYYNRLVFVRPNGEISSYDKRHLFTYAGEHTYYKAGRDRLVFNYLGWKICPMICYDLRFPVWSRNNLDYDVLLYVANWPEARTSHWKTLLPARAIENQCYVIAANRMGQDDLGLNYIGASAAINYSGESLLEMNNEEKMERVIISKGKMKAFREKLAFLKDQDQFEIMD